MESNKKSLVAYYSRKGENYAGGRIVDLKVGNTEVVAGKIKNMTGCDLFKIDTKKNYPADYTAATKVAQDELNNKARPELTGNIENMDQYDIVYLGYPNWWGTMPMAVYTFLETYDFSGKTIIPFCIHEGSGMGSSERDIKKMCPTAEVLPGLAIKGSSAVAADAALEKWLKNSIRRDF